MFKKVLAIILCLMFALTAVACGGNDSTDDTNGDTASTASENKPMFEGDTNQQITGYIAHAKLVENEPKDNGRTCEIISRDNALVYIYRYLTDFSDPKTVFGNIDKSYTGKKAMYEKIYNEMKDLVPTAEAVIFEFYTKSGELALSKKFVSGSEVVTGGAYAADASSSATGLYGKWSTNMDASADVVYMLTDYFDGAQFEVTGVYCVFEMQFNEDGSCVVTSSGSEAIYNTLIAKAQAYLEENDADNAATRLEEFKSVYTIESIKQEMDATETGTFALTGDPNTTGTIDLDGENLEGIMKFVINGSSLDLIPLDGEGNEFEDSKLTFTRK